MKNPKAITVLLLFSLLAFIIEVERKAIEDWWPPIHDGSASIVMMHFSDQETMVVKDCNSDKDL